jgi:hypothetical protein
MSNYNSEYSDSINPDNKVNIQKSTQGTPNYYGGAPQQPQPFQQPIQQQFGSVPPQNLYPNPQQNSYGTPTGYPQPQNSYGTPTGYPQPQYQYQQQYSPYPAQAATTQVATNKFAIISLVLSLLGFIVVPLAVVGIVLGHCSLYEIKRTGENGMGAAIAALVIGYIEIIGAILIVIIYLWVLLTVGQASGR